MGEVKLHLKKAHQKLQAAKVLLNNRLYADAVSRAYYAMFHAAKSEGYVDELLGKSFSAARENREFADYDIHVKITEEEAKETINREARN